MHRSAEINSDLYMEVSKMEINNTKETRNQKILNKQCSGRKHLSYKIQEQFLEKRDIKLKATKAKGRI